LFIPPIYRKEEEEKKGMIVVEMSSLLLRFTMDCIGDIAFDTDLGCLR